jgi:ribosomal protein S27AE
MDTATTETGERVYVDRTAAERGSKGPFYVVYDSATAESRYGFRCGNCESLATAMDTMGRIQCTACGNIRKPDEWDAAHE